MDFSGDRQSKVERVVSPFDGIDGTQTAAQREVQEEFKKRQMSVAPDAARDGLGKESAMSQMTAQPIDPKAADKILNNGATIIGATAADRSFDQRQVMSNPHQDFDVDKATSGGYTARAGNRSFAA